MRLGLDAVERVKDLAFGRNDEGRAFDAAAKLAVHHLFLHHAVGRACGFVLVGEKLEVELLAIAKAAVTLHAVARDSGNGITERFKL